MKAEDPPRYFATLFAPPSIRADLLAIYGFAAEIARVPRLVSEPGLGEIRLKWWSDALAEAVRREGQGETPALRAAAAAIARRSLPLAPFEGIADATAADLYSDPPATLSDLEGQMGERESALFQLAALALGGSGADTAEAAGHAGIAYGITRRLARFASDRARGRTILPAELLSAQGIAPAEIFAAEPPAGLARAVSALIDFAAGHRGRARAALTGIDPARRPAFLPLAVTTAMLGEARRLGSAIAHRDCPPSNIASLARIGWAGFTGG